MPQGQSLDKTSSISCPYFLLSMQSHWRSETYKMRELRCLPLHQQLAPVAFRKHEEARAERSYAFFFCFPFSGSSKRRNTKNWAAKARWSSLAAKTRRGCREHSHVFRRWKLLEVTSFCLVLTIAREWQSFENLAYLPSDPVRVSYLSTITDLWRIHFLKSQLLIVYFAWAEYCPEEISGSLHSLR